MGPTPSKKCPRQPMARAQPWGRTARRPRPAASRATEQPRRDKADERLCPRAGTARAAHAPGGGAWLTWCLRLGPLQKGLRRLVGEGNRAFSPVKEKISETA